MSEKAHTTDRLRQEALNFALFEEAKSCAMNYMAEVQDRRVFPDQAALDGLSRLDGPLSDRGMDGHAILSLLHEAGSPATVAQTGGRYFGFVNGGAVPAALAARWLSDVWDQNAALYVISPVSSRLEEICEKWVVGLLGLPDGTAAGFVSGSSLATACGLAAGRNSLLARQGYDVARKGLFGAPQIRVVLGAGAHSTVYKALSILGLGSDRVETVPVDSQGCMRADMVPELDGNTLLILQAGNVNSGAFDPMRELCEKANKAGAWVHVDGAFGLWVAASPRFSHLTDGIGLADSWSVDAHKTLNAPYDCGIALCRHRQALSDSLHMTGSYIQYSEQRDGMLYTPEMSRRGRAVELWAALLSLGRQGVAELVEDLHDKAAYFADCLRGHGFLIRNKVCFNQVLVSAGDTELTQKVLRGIQQSGECWCGGATWQGEPVIRVSVCSYRTTKEDVERSARAFVASRDAL